MGEVETMTNSTANVALDGAGRRPSAGARRERSMDLRRIETQRTDFQPPPGGALAVEASSNNPM